VTRQQAPTLRLSLVWKCCRVEMFTSVKEKAQCIAHRSSLIAHRSSLIARGILAVALLLGAVFFGASPASAAPLHGPITPESCYWVTTSQASGTLTAGGVNVGTYTVYLQYYTCTPSYHRALGQMVITNSTASCVSNAGFTAWVYADGGTSQQSSQVSGTIGGSSSSCVDGTTLTTATANVNTATNYCAELRSINYVVNTFSVIKTGNQCP
jgi:hypothetical protein